MGDDNTFRFWLLIVCAVFLPFAIYGRLRSLTDERLDRWQEGALILFGLRLSAAATFIVGLAWMLEPSRIRWSALDLPVWLRWLGIGCAAGAGSLVLWTFANLGKNLTDTVVTRREHTLVKSGPYRYVRHPFYDAFALGLLGVTLAMSNWLILFAGIVPLVFIIARTRIEERKLIERFGGEYLSYMRDVPRFLPFTSPRA